MPEPSLPPVFLTEDPSSSNTKKIRKRTLVLVILLLLLLLAGGVFAFWRMRSGSAPSAPENSNVPLSPSFGTSGSSGDERGPKRSFRERELRERKLQSRGNRDRRGVGTAAFGGFSGALGDHFYPRRSLHREKQARSEAGPHLENQQALRSEEHTSELQSQSN